ncbi:ABC transporter permease [Candidatus Woesearchaeota archaeon]|nr:ABC transporter permease [Candidatus Woesearchaeota archaeon]
MSEAIYVMWLRQLKRYWRSKPRLIGSLAQPILFLIAFGFGFGPTFQKAGGGDYIQFLAPGIIAMTTLFTAMFSGIEVIWDRKFGFLKETLVAPVPRIYIMLGKTIGGATVAVIQGIVVLMLTLIVGFRPNVTLLPLAFLFLALIALFFTSFGIAIASKIEDMQAFPLIMNFIIMPLFFLSGALFPINGLPKPIEIIVRINPLHYGVEGLRNSLMGITGSYITVNILILLVLTAIMNIIGSLLFSKVEL